MKNRFNYNPLRDFNFHPNPKYQKFLVYFIGKERITFNISENQLIPDMRYRYCGVQWQLIRFLNSSHQDKHYIHWVRIWRLIYNRISTIIKNNKMGLYNHFYIEEYNKIEEEYKTRFYKNVNNYIKMHIKRDNDKFAELCKIMLDYRELNKNRNKEYMKSKRD